MLKMLQKILPIASATLGVLLFVSGESLAEPVRDSPSEYNLLEQEALQFSDVSPEDWAFPALNNLVQGNDCLDLALGYRARWNFDTSFTGRDRLRTRLQAGNLQNNAQLSTETTNTEPTNAETQDSNKPLSLGYRARLNFDTSFTGRDRLRTRLQARNLQNLSQLGTETSNTEPTNMATPTTEVTNVETQQTACKLR